MNELDSIVAAARASFAAAGTAAELENAKALYTGKAGRITELMKGMGALSVDEKKTRGAAINVAKQAIEAALTQRRHALAEAELEAQLKAVHDGLPRRYYRSLPLLVDPPLAGHQP